MRIAAEWLASAALQDLFDLFEGAGQKLFAVGGCVRNTLLREAVGDIDLATDTHPDRVMALSEAAGFRAIPTGLSHGTVTVVSAGTPFEITTFRADIETDGRHAIVRFATDLETDARRRDFTMNALYADRHGRVTDVVGGLADIAARRVRFIGQADMRLVEDRLRALRYFRFLAWYGDPARGADQDALAAIAAHLDGMALLSRERINQEWLKLLAAPDPGLAVASMDRVGLVRVLFERASSERLPRLVHAEEQLALAPDPIVRLAGLGLPSPETSLRLSRAQSGHLARLCTALEADQPPAVLGYRLGATEAAQVLALRCATFESVPCPDELGHVARGAAARFPVAANDLMPDLTGSALGAALARLEAAWIASDFTLDRNALLALR